MPPRKILLVDDDPDLIHALTLVLERQGYQVVSALDPHRGLVLADTERPDLIVLDVMMPEGTEGFHFVWNIRTRPDAYFQQVPIVMLTAIHQRTALRFYPDSTDGTYQAGEYLPVQGFVDKPVEPAVLLAEVERVLASVGCS